MYIFPEYLVIIYLMAKPWWGSAVAEETEEGCIGALVEETISYKKK
jgi:hypothetical protein